MGLRAGGLVARDHGRALVLTPWWESGPGEPLATRDPGAASALALQLLGRSSLDQARVRSVLARVEPSASPPRSDSELAAVLVARLVDGRLRVSLVDRATLWAKGGEEEEPLAVLERAEAPVIEAQEEECIPCREKNAQHQAEVLMEASMDGLPFCGMA